MQIDVQSRSLDVTPPLRALAVRRIRFALSRYADRVRGVQVRLADLNGPRGGLDQRCQLEISLERGGPIVVEVTDFQIEHAIGRAGRRAARVLREGEAKRITRHRRGASRSLEAPLHRARGAEESPGDEDDLVEEDEPLRLSS